jgi:hypothetical protein
MSKQSAEPSSQALLFQPDQSLKEKSISDVPRMDPYQEPADDLRPSVQAMYDSICGYCLEHGYAVMHEEWNGTAIVELRFSDESGMRAFWQWTNELHATYQRKIDLTVRFYENDSCDIKYFVRMVTPAPISS